MNETALEEKESFANEQDALNNYLSALLASVPEYVPGAEESGATPEPEPAPPVPPSAELSASTAQSESATPQTETAQSPATLVCPPALLPLPSPATQPLTPVPEWAQQTPIPLVVVRLGAIKLALPMTTLSGVTAWPGMENIHHLPGNPPWVLGVLNQREGYSRVLDSDRLILPPGHRRSSEQARNSWKHLLFFDDYRWALAVDSLHRTLRVEHKDIRWRRLAGNRPWLAGILIEELCVVLEVKKMGQLLEKGHELV